MKSTQGRVNARLSPDLAAKVDAVRQRTGRSTSDLVSEGLTRLCDAELAGGTSAFHALVDVGFVGCASAKPDLSVTYKSALTNALIRNHRGP